MKYATVKNYFFDIKTQHLFNFSELNKLKKGKPPSLRIASPEEINIWGERYSIDGNLRGIIKDFSGISIRKPTVLGFFSEQIFGTTKPWTCACRNAEAINPATFNIFWIMETSLEKEGFQFAEDTYISYICEYCGVEYNDEAFNYYTNYYTNYNRSGKNRRYMTFGHIRTEMPLIHPLFIHQLHEFLNWSIKDLYNILFRLTFSVFQVLQNWTFFSSQSYYYYVQENKSYLQRDIQFFLSIYNCNEYDFLKNSGLLYFLYNINYLNNNDLEWNNLFNELNTQYECFIKFFDFHPILLKKKENYEFIYDFWEHYFIDWVPVSLCVGEIIIQDNFINLYGISSNSYWYLHWPFNLYFLEFFDLFWIEQTQLDKPQIPYLLKQRFFLERTLQIDYPLTLNVENETNFLVGSEIPEMILLRDYFFFEKLTNLHILYNNFLVEFFFKRFLNFFHFIYKNRNFQIRKKRLLLFWIKGRINSNYPDEMIFTLLVFEFFLKSQIRRENQMKKKRKIKKKKENKITFVETKSLNKFKFFFNAFEKDIMKKMNRRTYYYKKLELDFKFSFDTRKFDISRLKTKTDFLFGGLNPFWILLRRILVLPPEYRPVIEFNTEYNIQKDNDNFLMAEEASLFISDINHFYRNLLYSVESYWEFQRDNMVATHLGRPQFTFGESTPIMDYFGSAKYLQQLWIIFWESRVGFFLNSQECLTHLIRPSKPTIDYSESFGIPKTELALKSLLDRLKGKTGYIRQYLLGRRVDYSGRSVIASCPELEIYECGLPFELALILFAPFLRKLRKRKKGYKLKLDSRFSYKIIESKLSYKTYIKQLKRVYSNKYPKIQKDYLWDLLTTFCKMNPILLNRAPTLHRKGIQGFIPRLSKSKAIELHPLVCPAFNADFDGDQMAIHLPVTESSRIETLNVLWSSLAIHGIADGEPIITPAQDMILGINYMTLASKKRLLFNSLVHKIVWIDLSNILIHNSLTECFIQIENVPMNIIHNSHINNFEEIINSYPQNDISEVHLLQNGLYKKITSSFFISINSIVLFFLLQKQKIFFKTTSGRFLFNKNLSSLLEKPMFMKTAIKGRIKKQVNKRDIIFVVFLNHYYLNFIEFYENFNKNTL